MTAFATLMVRLAAGAPNDALLKLTGDLAVRLRIARVIGISACQPIQIYDTKLSDDLAVRLKIASVGVRQPFQTYATPDMCAPRDVTNWSFEQIDRDLKAAEKEFRAALQGKVAVCEWRSTVVSYGSIADYMVEQMRAADLLITATQEDGSLFDASRRVNVTDLVLRAGRPVLVVAPGVDRLDLRTVVVGWKETREARRAVQDALPLLRLAEQVVVIEIADAGDLADARRRTQDVADWLGRHGVRASARAVRAAIGEADQLRNLAGDPDLDAGLVVAGAYGHTRLREWVLGGVTRDLLLEPSRCSLVSH